MNWRTWKRPKLNEEIYHVHGGNTRYNRASIHLQFSLQISRISSQSLMVLGKNLYNDPLSYMEE